MRYLLLLLVSIAYGVASAAELEQARSHINSMEYQQAIKAIKDHLKQHGEDIAALHLLAKTYAWDNQYTQAEQTYDLLLSKEPDNTLYQFGKAQAMVWQNKNKQAIPILESIRQHVPEQSEVWRLLILTLQQTNEAQDRQRAAQLSIEASKKFPKEFWDIATE